MTADPWGSSPVPRPPQPTRADYLPRPKVVAAVLSGLLVIGLLFVARAVGIDIDAGWAWGLLAVGGAGAGGYLKSER